MQRAHIHADLERVAVWVPSPRREGLATFLDTHWTEPVKWPGERQPGPAVRWSTDHRICRLFIGTQEARAFFFATMRRAYELFWDPRIDPDLGPGAIHREGEHLARWYPPGPEVPRFPVLMRIVHDPDRGGPTLALFIPNYLEDFHVEFDLGVPAAQRRFDTDLRTWFVDLPYMAAVFAALERYYQPTWDTMILRDWEGLPVPEDTQYPVRSAAAEDFKAFGLPPSASLDEVRTAWREKKDQHYRGGLGDESYLRLEEAFERLMRFLGSQTDSRAYDEDAENPFERWTKLASS